MNYVYIILGLFIRSVGSGETTIQKSRNETITVVKDATDK